CAVCFVDVRDQLRLDASGRGLDDDFVDPGAVCPLYTFGRCEREDFLLRASYKPAHRLVDLCAALDDLESDGGLVLRPASGRGPGRANSLSDRLEGIEFRTLLLGDHVEHLVSGAGGVPLRAFERDLDKPAALQAL